MNDTDLIGLTADIVSAHVSHNSISTAEVPTLIRSVYEALNRAGQPEIKAEPAPEPAVPVRSSIKPDYLVCLEDGKKLKMLKRYLRTNYNMTPDEYRAKWGLPKDYPMVAPNYREARSALAHQIGLGRKPAAVAAAPKAVKAPAKAAKAPTKAAKAPVAAAKTPVAAAKTPVAAAKTPVAAAKAPAKPAKTAAPKQPGIRAAKAAARRHLGTAKPLTA